MKASGQRFLLNPLVELHTQLEVKPGQSVSNGDAIRVGKV